MQQTNKQQIPIFIYVGAVSLRLHSPSTHPTYLANPAVHFQLAPTSSRWSLYAHPHKLRPPADSLIDLYMAMFAQGVPYDLELHGEDFALFEGTGTGVIIASIRLFLQNQEAVTVFFSRIIDEWHGASRGNKSK
jgi:hypothetical protein